MTERIAFKSTATVEGRNIRGSVTLKGARTFRNGEYVEVDPAALVKADASNVFGLFDHDDAKVLGRTSNGTLSFTRDENGFDYEIHNVPNTTAGNDALELAKGGYLNGSSFQIDGLKSEFSTDPDGTRVRRYTSIKRLIDISPVFDPAFSSSSVAAFSKESEVTDDIKEPVAAPAEPKAETPKVTFSAPADDKSDFYRRAEAFARDKSLGDLEAFMENLVSEGLDSGAKRDQYDAFAHVYDERKKTDGEAADRLERIALAHKMRLGLVSKGPQANSGVFESDDYKQAFRQYLASTVETFAMNTARMTSFAQTVGGDGSQGGFTVPDGFVNQLTERLKAYGGISTVADEITTSTGESLRWPYIDDTANKAVIAAEDVQAASGADLAFESIELGAFEYDATGASGNPIEMSLTLIQDSAFDLVGRLTDVLGTRIGRKQADHFATGAGGTEPLGLLSKAADTMTATVASLAAAEHYFQVDAAYRRNAVWVMSDTSLAKLVTAQATTNEPLFLPGRTLEGEPFGTLLGRPIINDPSAGNLVAFGDIKAGYIIRRVRGVQLLVDPYTAQKRRAVQYHAWARADATIQEPGAYSVSSWVGVSADT